MAFVTYAGVFTVDAVDQIPVAYLARSDMAQVALLDTTTNLHPADFLIYRSHVVTEEGDKRDTRKRTKRLYIFGNGTITVGTLVITADNMRSESYQINNINLAGTMPNQGVLIQQGTNGLTGRVFDIALTSIGVGVEISEIQLQATIID